MEGNINTIMPIFDEYTLESKRMDFIYVQDKHLLEDTKVDHLAYDTDSHINSKDIGEGILYTKELK